MMTVLVLLGAVLLGVTKVQAQRTVELLNFGWRFHAGDVADAAQPGLDGSTCLMTFRLSSHG